MSVSLEEIRAGFRAEIAQAKTTDLLVEVRKLQAARGWDFDRAWCIASAENPTLIVSAGEAGTPKDPRMAEALRKLKQLEDDKSDLGIQRHVKLLDEVRKLRSRDSSMTHDEAMLRVFRTSPELWPGAKEPAPATVPARHGAPMPIGSSYLVTAESAVQFDGLPAVIQYMPPGESRIRPSVNGVPKEITVTVTPTTASRLQADLSRLLSQNVRPFIDFDHKGGAAAAVPKRFFWKEGEGVMLELDWTGAGKTAVAGQNYAHFSATFTINKDGDLINLPPSGAIGSLVNDPAFRSGRRLMAAAYSV